MVPQDMPPPPQQRKQQLQVTSSQPRAHPTPQLRSMQQGPTSGCWLLCSCASRVWGPPRAAEYDTLAATSRGAINPSLAPHPAQSPHHQAWHTQLNIAQHPPARAGARDKGTHAGRGGRSRSCPRGAPPPTASTDWVGRGPPQTLNPNICWPHMGAHHRVHRRVASGRASALPATRRRRAGGRPAASAAARA